jgi:hypothetical protein
MLVYKGFRLSNSWFQMMVATLGLAGAVVAVGGMDVLVGAGADVFVGWTATVAAGALVEVGVVLTAQALRINAATVHKINSLYNFWFIFSS